MESKMTKKYFLSVSDDAEFLKMDYAEFTNWCSGRLIVAIGQGDFRSEVVNIIRFAGDWRIYNTPLDNA
jgi:hypothetical protein